MSYAYIIVYMKILINFNNNNNILLIINFITLGMIKLKQIFVCICLLIIILQEERRKKKEERNA